MVKSVFVLLNIDVREFISVVIMVVNIRFFKFVVMDIELLLIKLNCV